MEGGAAHRHGATWALRAARGSPSAARPPGPADILPLSSRRHFESNLSPRRLKGHSPFNGALFPEGWGAFWNVVLQKGGAPVLEAAISKKKKKIQPKN